MELVRIIPVTLTFPQPQKLGGVDGFVGVERTPFELGQPEQQCDRDGQQQAQRQPAIHSAGSPQTSTSVYRFRAL